jgi:hypothetical protein
MRLVFDEIHARRGDGRDEQRKQSKMEAVGR